MTLRDQAKFRKRLIELDGEQCRNPFHEELIKDLIARGLLFWPVVFRFIAHHIKFKSHGVDNSPENGIMLCQYCDYAVHNGHGKGENRLSARQYMLKILNGLVGAVDYRWHEVHEEYRKRYGEAA